MESAKEKSEENTSDMGDSSNKLEQTTNSDVMIKKFYDAISSGNVENLKILISNWAGSNNYDFKKLDEILSTAYQEIKLKNICISDEMIVLIENKLVNFRFFSSTKDIKINKINFKLSLCNIKERISFVLDNINLSLKVNDAEKFVYILKSIVQNLFVLKNQLRSTYEKLPWEEIEFCVTCIISSYTKEQELNLFNCLVLTKESVLKYLKDFADELSDVNKELGHSYPGKINALPIEKREIVVSNIIEKNSKFDDLYDDYEQLRDIHSLYQINNYLKLASTVNASEKDGQLVIIRALQVTGEHLKNTLQSPKLSHITSELILMKLPKNTRKILIDLRDTLSHSQSLLQRCELEANTNVEFFSHIQNDIKKLYVFITDIFFKYKIKATRILFERIMKANTFNEVKSLLTIINNAELENIPNSHNTISEIENIQKLLDKFSTCIPHQEEFLKERFQEMKKIIKEENEALFNVKFDYTALFMGLKQLQMLVFGARQSENHMTIIKFLVNKALERFSDCHDSKKRNFQKIAELSLIIHQNCKPLITSKDCELSEIVCEILFIVRQELNCFKWIEELRTKFLFKNNSNCFISCKKSVSLEKFEVLLKKKLSDLSSTLNNELVLENSTSLPKMNQHSRAIIEMLVLDIMSILDSSKNCLANNQMFVDDINPVLLGKCLRNHLAHNNPLIELLNDPFVTILANAVKLSQVDDLIKSKKTIGKVCKEDILKVKVNFERGLSIIENQTKMFTALQIGDLQELRNCLKNGADINGRNYNLWTSVHFAAKGQSKKVLKFLDVYLKDFDCKDMNGKTPLYIASEYNSNKIVEFLLVEKCIDIHKKDDKGKSALHIAALNGSKETVEVLLKHNADINRKDIIGYSPIHYAAQNNYNEIIKILLKKQVDPDANKTLYDSFTPLHISAENGHTDIVKYLLENSADPNLENHKGSRPLHLAAIDGHLAVVNLLISFGAEVNAINLDKCTALHYAVEYGHESVANALLNNTADVNVLNVHSNTPVHYAARFGCAEILKNMLKHNANVKQKSFFGGLTPLHYAVKFKKEAIVEILLENNAYYDINMKNYNKSTLLHYAAENGCKNIVQLLLKLKAWVNIKDFNGFTPLHMASRNGHVEIMKILLNSGAKVNAVTKDGFTPLHFASSCLKDNVKTVEILLKYDADINAKNNKNFTPLHTAAMKGNSNILKVLLENNAEIKTKAISSITPLYSAVYYGNVFITELLLKKEVNIESTDDSGNTPLHVAAKMGSKKLVDILLKYNCNINAKNSHKLTPLLFAIKNNDIEIVKVLVENSVNINCNGGEAIKTAVMFGFIDVIKILLQNYVITYLKYENDYTLLHFAAEKGHGDIINCLIKTMKDVNARTSQGETSLFLAARHGFHDIVKTLIGNKGDINIADALGNTPLHVAAKFGHVKVIEILLTEKANISDANHENLKPIELAIHSCDLQAVKLFFSTKKININEDFNEGQTLLHVASQFGNVELIEFLVNEGADLKAKNKRGEMPSHIAAREGKIQVLDYLIKNGSDINSRTLSNQTLLHYAAQKGHLDIAEYLIKLSVDINFEDQFLQTPLIVASKSGHKDFVKLLLQNGASNPVLNSFFNRLGIPQNVLNVFEMTEKLLDLVNHNAYARIDDIVKSGAIVNAKDQNQSTPLLNAVLKGYVGTVDALLKNKADPNSSDKNGCTCLHYAAKLSHEYIVKSLLSHGAIYSKINNNGKTPICLTTQKSVIDLLQLIDNLFRLAKQNHSKFFINLKNIKNTKVLKAVMNAKNSDNKTLTIVALDNNFSDMQKLYANVHSNYYIDSNEANSLFLKNKLEQGLDIIKRLFRERLEMLGPENPGTLDIKRFMGRLLFKQKRYVDSLSLHNEVYELQIKVLGVNHRETMDTRNDIALVMYEQGKYTEALEIYKELYKRQNELYGNEDKTTLDTQTHMALVLCSLQRYDDALKINRRIYNKYEKLFGKNDLSTLVVLNNIGTVLVNLEKYDEAIKYFDQVYEKRKKILGPNHGDTLRVWSHKINAISKESIKNNSDEMTKLQQEVFQLQKNELGEAHADTITTEINMAINYFNLGRIDEALKILLKTLKKSEKIFGKAHPDVITQIKMIESIIQMKRKFDTGAIPNFDLNCDVLVDMLKKSGIKINVASNEDNVTIEDKVTIDYEANLLNAANYGDIQLVRQLIHKGVNINQKDKDGITPLQFAVSSGNVKIVDILLENGADPLAVSNKNNTLIHAAVSKNNAEILSLLLEKTGVQKMRGIINIKTSIKKTAALHIAAKSGNLRIVKLLLKCGANYNIKNGENKTPLDLSPNCEVSNFLNFIDDSFKNAELGILNRSKIISLELDELMCLLSVTDWKGNCLTDIYTNHNYTEQFETLVSLLKKNQK